MAAVMQRDCPFHGALRGKTYVATSETHANDTHIRARVKLRAAEIEVALLETSKRGR